MSAAADLGRLVPPLPVDDCANIDCPHDRASKPLEVIGAYLFKDLETDKLVVFCTDCAYDAELNAGHRFKLVAL